MKGGKYIYTLNLPNNSLAFKTTFIAEKLKSADISLDLLEVLTVTQGQLAPLYLYELGIIKLKTKSDPAIKASDEILAKVKDEILAIINNGSRYTKNLPDNLALILRNTLIELYTALGQNKDDIDKLLNLANTINIKELIDKGKLDLTLHPELKEDKKELTKSHGKITKLEQSLNKILSLYRKETKLQSIIPSIARLILGVIEKNCKIDKARLKKLKNELDLIRKLGREEKINEIKLTRKEGELTVVIPEGIKQKLYFRQDGQNLIKNIIATAKSMNDIFDRNNKTLSSKIKDIGVVALKEIKYNINRYREKNKMLSQPSYLLEQLVEPEVNERTMMDLVAKFFYNHKDSDNPSASINSLKIFRGAILKTQQLFKEWNKFITREYQANQITFSEGYTLLACYSYYLRAAEEIAVNFPDQKELLTLLATLHAYRAAGIEKDVDRSRKSQMPIQDIISTIEKELLYQTEGKLKLEGHGYLKTFSPTKAADLRGKNTDNQIGIRGDDLNIPGASQKADAGGNEKNKDIYKELGLFVFTILSISIPILLHSHYNVALIFLAVAVIFMYCSKNRANNNVHEEKHSLPRESDDIEAAPIAQSESPKINDKFVQRLSNNSNNSTTIYVG